MRSFEHRLLRANGQSVGNRKGKRRAYFSVTRHPVGTLNGFVTREGSEPVDCARERGLLTDLIGWLSEARSASREDPDMVEQDPSLRCEEPIERRMGKETQSELRPASLCIKERER